MKLKVFIISLLVASFMPIFAFGNHSFKTINSFDNFTSSDIDAIVGRYVPEDYRSAFYHYTDLGDKLSTANLRLQILAIGKHESGWKNVISKPNKNGTRDIGYLQLNSANLNNSWFMSRFGPESGSDYGKDLAEIALITCINYYKTLYASYGEDAVYCYNAGEGRYKKGSLPDSTIAYKRIVGKYLSGIIAECETYKLDRIINNLLGFNVLSGLAINIGNTLNLPISDTIINNFRFPSLNSLNSFNLFENENIVLLSYNFNLSSNTEDSLEVKKDTITLIIKNKRLSQVVLGISKRKEMDDIIKEIKSHGRTNSDYRYLGDYKPSKDEGCVASVFMYVPKNKIVVVVKTA